MPHGADPAPPDAERPTITLNDRANRYESPQRGADVYGRGGDDYLASDAQGPNLYGEAGNDTLVGGAGDVLVGGAGADRFVIGPYGSVQIGDWQVGETIDLTSWGGTPQYLQLTSNSVRILNGSRAVFVNSATAITVAQVQSAVIL